MGCAARVTVLRKPFDNIVPGFRRVFEDSFNNVVDWKITPACVQLCDDAFRLVLVAGVVISNGERYVQTAELHCQNYRYAIKLAAALQRKSR